MTYKEFATKLKDLRSMGDSDPEVRHGEEDNLIWEFVYMVANSPSHFSDIAQLLVEYDKMPRKRWYA